MKYLRKRVIANVRFYKAFFEVDASEHLLEKQLIVCD